MADQARNQAAAPGDRGGAERERNSAKAITQSLLKHVPDLVESCQAAALFVYVDAMDDPSELSFPGLHARVFYVTKALEKDRPSQHEEIQYVRVPDVPLTRMGQVKIAVFLALSRGFIQYGDRVVFLSGVAAARTLDTIIVTEVGREYEIFTSETDLMTSPKVLPEVIEKVVDIASELGSEGREGKPVGTMFVVGDTDRVLPLTRQLVLNPFKGYPQSERNILDYSLEETIKELATLDGAFIIQGDGVVETCGAYIRTASQEEFELPRGLGARHHAAAAITAVTDSIAVTVSESTGSVTIFRSGRMVTEIQKPRSSSQKSKLHRISRPKSKKRNNPPA
jgi:DNA integrity scanning protein DisA with diadenylate cyclase activity